MAAALASVSGAATFQEDFSTAPQAEGWRVFGDASLFRWDATDHDLEVTWDSSQTNSYFYRPLGTILTKADDFSLAVDWQLRNVSVSGFGFETAIGFFRLADSTSPSFKRGTGTDSPNLVELDYFPDVGYGPTLWPLFVNTTSTFNWNGTSDYAIYAPTGGDWYHVVMNYSASNQTMITTMTNFEGTSGVRIVDPLNSSFGDFRVDTISISSYSGADSGGAILAQGTIGRLVVVVPDPPVRDFSGSFSGGGWRAGFDSSTNWVYTLERTRDFISWTDVTPPVDGTGATLFLEDAAAPVPAAFYRIRATRP